MWAAENKQSVPLGSLSVRTCMYVCRNAVYWLSKAREGKARKDEERDTICATDGALNDAARKVRACELKERT
jgi:hypothetical protein